MSCLLGFVELLQLDDLDPVGALRNELLVERVITGDVRATLEVAHADPEVLEADQVLLRPVCPRACPTSLTSQLLDSDSRYRIDNSGRERRAALRRRSKPVSARSATSRQPVAANGRGSVSLQPVDCRWPGVARGFFSGCQAACFGAPVKNRRHYLGERGDGRDVVVTLPAALACSRSRSTCSWIAIRISPSIRRGFDHIFVISRSSGGGHRQKQSRRRRRR